MFTMRKATFVAVMLVGGARTAVLAQGSSASAGAVPVDQLLTINSVVGSEPPRWSPDGSRILFASGLGGGLMTVPASGGFPRKLPVALGGVGFLGSQNIGYSPDGRWVSYISDKSGAEEVWLWSIEDGRDVKLTSAGARINSMSWSPDSRFIAFSSDRYGNFDVWKASVPDGHTTRLTSADEYEVFPTWTPDSRSILYVKLDKRWADHDVIEIAADGSSPRVVLQDKDFFDYGAGKKFDFPTLSFDGKWILFPSYRSGWINYWVAPVAGGAEPRTIAPEAADQSDASWSPDGKSVLFVSNHNGTHEIRVVPAAGGTARVVVPVKSGVAASPSWSPDGKRIAYTLGTTTSPSDLFVVAVSGGASNQLTYSLPEGNLDRTFVTPEKITYPSTAGLSITAYLYKPVARTAGEKFPAIVWTHGGPTSQYNDAFQQDVQFFVQRGYVVLQPNIRGSSGYGRRFEDMNNKCWGHCDLEDVVAAADYLKKLPYVNGAKLGTTGSSYGGFMTCAAIVWAPGLFQAAVESSGYCNRVSFVDEGEFRHIQQLAYEFGPFEENKDIYYKNSPFFGIKNVKTPTFILNGCCKFPGSRQNEKFAEAMEKEYKVFKFKEYPGENYYVRGRDNHKQVLLDMLEWFDRYLKDGVSEVERVAASASR
jgi:dipeptidyl aminopeptidase/acylaminoacyl peptidase